MDGQFTSLLSTLDPVKRQIVMLAMQGSTVETIADEVKRSSRTVRREIQRFEQELERRRVESV